MNDFAEVLFKASHIDRPPLMHFFAVYGDESNSLQVRFKLAFEQSGFSNKGERRFNTKKAITRNRFSCYDGIVRSTR
jgi:hypothetical protein